NIQIARRPAKRARFAESGKANARAVLDSRGHLRFDHTLAQQAAFASALRARIGDYAARTLAGWASARDAKEALLIAHLAASVARLTMDRGFAGRCAGTAARVARLMAANTHLPLGAEHRFAKFQMQVFTQIGPALGAAAPP